MRIYSAEDLDTLQTLKLLKDWQDEGLLTEQQGELQDEIVPDLDTTNLFLRVVLFLFTVGILVLIQSLVLMLLSLSSLHPTDRTSVIPFFLFSAVCYVAAEYAVREVRLYHFGSEEASAVCSIGFLFWGLQAGHTQFKPGSDVGEVLILTLCAAFSLWIWHRFGYWYTFVAAMAFFAAAPFCVTTSPTAQHTFVATLYAAGLIGIIAAGSRERFEHLRRFYSVAEAFLWAGIYLSLNLVPWALLPRWFDDSIPSRPSFSAPFYWFTWVLIWCMSPVVLLRGIRRKDRILISLGAGLTIATFVSNKAYLGWQRHPWDPMLLGIVLMGAAWYLQRWLADGPDGIRSGFTAARLTGKQNAWMEAGTSAFSLIAPHAGGHGSQSGTPIQPLGEGGASGGGGAGGDF